jgi:LysM repeat protein
MQRHLFLSIGSLLFSISCLAAAPIDSVGVEVLNGKKVIVHKVEARESYYSISRKYNVSPQLTIQFNNNKSLQIGVLVKVPTNKAFGSESVVNVEVNSKPSMAANTAVVEYKVGAKETFYSISRKFNTTIEAIKTLNKISGNSLAAGQIIKIVYGTQTAEITPPTQIILPKIFTDGRKNDSTQIDSSINAGDRLRLPPARYGLREVDAHGVALSIADENLDGSKMLALHQTAPIGTVVKVTNPMSGKSTFAKVVGKFTENESTKDVIIVITKATANMIGALDNRFQVNIVYGVPHE